MRKTRFLMPFAVSTVLAIATSVAPSQPALARQPGALPAQVRAACGTTSPSSKVVRIFDRYRAITTDEYMAGGKSALYCGDQERGYRHIVVGHLGDWQNMAFLTGENWRDVADYSIEIVLADPGAVTYNERDQTFCFSRLIDLIRLNDGRVVGTKVPRVGVSGTNEQVITAFPTTVNAVRQPPENC